MQYNNDITRQLIIDHYENPRFKVEDASILNGYSTANNDSPSCIDNVTAYVKINNNVVEDVRYSGVACAICTSSTDLMAKILIGKTIDDANTIFNSYSDMILNNKIDNNILDYLVIFRNVSKQANRVKCALTGVEAIKKAIDGGY